MANASGIRAGGAFVEIFADDSKLTQGLGRAAASLKAWGASVSGVGIKLAALGGAITAPLLGAAHVYTDTASALGKMSLRTGIAVEELSALSYVASRSGLDIEGLEMGIKKMEQTLFKGGEGSAEARRALTNLGVSLKELQGLTPDKQLEKLADAFKHIDDPAKKTGLAMAIFGKQGTTMIPFLEKGSEEIEKLKNHAKEMGIVLGVDDVKVAKEFKAAMTDLKAAGMAVTIAIGQAVIPAMTRMRVMVMPIVSGVVSWVRENKRLFDTLFDVGTAITAAGVGLIVIGKAMSLMGPALLGVWKLAGLAVAGFVGSLKLVAVGFAFLFTPIGALLLLIGSVGLAWVLFTDSGKAAAKTLADAWKGFAEIFKTTMGGIVNAFKAGDLVLAGKIAFTGLKVAWFELINAMKLAWQTLWADLQRVQSDQSGNLAKGLVTLGHAAGLISFDRARDLVNDIDQQTRAEQQRLNGRATLSREDLDALANAKAELKKLTDEARVKATPNLDIRMAQAGAGLPGALAEAGSGVGTFSAQGALAMGAGQNLAQLIDVGKDNRNFLRQILDVLREGGARFG